MNYPEVGSNWRMIINTDNKVDQLTIEVESKSLLSQMESMELEEKLRNDIKSVLVFNPKILVLHPKSIIQEGLKAKRVIDNRKKV
jgi:phenylacetate-CoA ligase